MKTAIRRPKLNKPTKGQKNYLKQGLNAFKRAIAMAADPEPRKKQHWYTARAVRASWLLGLRGSHMPHQGAQEKARRVKQMAARTHGYPNNPLHQPQI